jgi:RND family efflux transporter MFP subunit
MRYNWIVLLASLITPALSAQPPSKAVRLAPVEQHMVVPQTMVTAQVQSRAQSDVSAGVDGRVLWLVEPGTHVEAGEVIARLDTTQLQLQLDEMQARLQQAEIQWQRLQKDSARLQALSQQQSVALTQLDLSSAERDSAAAQVRLLQAQLAQLQDLRSRSQVRAPFAGVVAQRFHQQGEDISRTDALLRLVNLAELDVVVQAPLRYASFVQPGQTLTVFYSDGQQSLKVQSVIPVSDLRSQTFEARLRVPSRTNHPFQVGQMVAVAIPTGIAKLQWLVPRDALVLRQTGQVIFTVNAARQAQQVAVTLGQGHGDFVAITANVKQGDQVVVRGGDTLADGDAVQVLVEPSSALFSPSLIAPALAAPELNSSTLATGATPTRG